MSSESVSPSSSDGSSKAEGKLVPAAGEEQEPEPEVDIVINNVVCSFSVRCHLNLRDIATRGINVEYRRENGVSSIDWSGAGPKRF